jgi:hypothetical protein
MSGRAALGKRSPSARRHQVRTVPAGAEQRLDLRDQLNHAPDQPLVITVASLSNVTYPQFEPLTPTKQAARAGTRAARAPAPATHEPSRPGDSALSGAYANSRVGEESAGTVLGFCRTLQHWGRQARERKELRETRPLWAGPEPCGSQARPPRKPRAHALPPGARTRSAIAAAVAMAGCSGSRDTCRRWAAPPNSASRSGRAD